MKVDGHAVAWTGIGVLLATVGALLQTPAQPPRQAGITALLPAGATLVLQAKDFASLVGDWNTSAEKTKWLAGANYGAFARSRLFLRLEGAYGEFAAAAGVPPDMALVSAVAGAESALALYDIGKLEFLYVTRLPSARAMENALWRTRGTFEPRQADGTPFYVRVNPESKRVVAFGVRDQYLVLATREDLLAGALTLIGGRGGASVETEGWFAQSVKAAGTPGDVRLVANLATLVRQPHFRWYWVQQNIAELSQYLVHCLGSDPHVLGDSRGARAVAGGGETRGRERRRARRHRPARARHRRPLPRLGGATGRAGDNAHFRESDCDERRLGSARPHRAAPGLDRGSDGRRR